MNRCVQTCANVVCTLINRKKQTANQLANQEAVCNMIDALMENSYDESGEILLQTDFDFKHWRQGSQYVQLVRQVGGGQLLGLFCSATVCLAIAGYAIYLHKKLWYAKPWTPPRSVMDCNTEDAALRAQAGRMCRIESGIGSMRSFGPQPPPHYKSMEDK